MNNIHRINKLMVDVFEAIEADSIDLTSAWWCEDEAEAEDDPELEDDAEDWSEGLSCCIAAGFSSEKKWG